MRSLVSSVCVRPFAAIGLLVLAPALPHAIGCVPGPLAAQSTETVAGTDAHGVDASTLHPGDRILLLVEGERTLSDTFTVRAGPAITLPNIGVISLAGVPLPDLNRYLTEQIGRYLKAPVVHATALVRVGVIGEVAKPGFYALPFDAVIADALTAAGGLTRDASVSQIHLQRGTTDVRDDTAIRLAMERGATLDEVGVAGGDQFVVPRNRDTERLIRILGVLVTIPAAIIALAQVAR